LPPLTRDCTQTYIEFRLTKAGYNGSQLFTPSAIDAIFRASQGIPRVINILCHKAMMVAFGLGDQSIDSHHVVRAVNDTDSIEREKSLKQRLFGL